MANTNFTRTYGASSNKGTVSMWVKRCSNAANMLYKNVSTTGSTNYGNIEIAASGVIEMMTVTSGSHTCKRETTQKFTDNNAWYHFVFSSDTDNSTPADRLIIWVNGERLTDFATNDSAAGATNYLHSISGTNENVIGSTHSSSGYLDGYMAQVVVVHGSQLNASVFAETDATTGEWKPKADADVRSAVTFGTQGAMLTFQNVSYPGYDYQTSDRSGTTNDYTKSGSGFQSVDTPSNNFALINGSFASTGTSSNVSKTLTYGNLTGYPTGNNGLVANMGASKGKWYWEVRPVAAYAMMGIISGSAASLGTYDADYASGFTTYGGNKAIMVGTAGSDLQLMNVTTSDTTWGTALNESTDVLGVAMDLDNNNIYFSVNGVWQNSGVPTSGATGTGAVAITVQSGFPALGDEVWLPAQHSFSGTATVQYNFGQGYFATTSAGATNADDAGQGVFKYDVPAGFYALCTQNLKTYG